MFVITQCVEYYYFHDYNFLEEATEKERLRNVLSDTRIS